MALKEQVFELHDLISDMVDGIDNLYTGFIYNNPKIVEDVGEGASAAEARISALTEEIVEEAKHEPRASLYVSVPSHVGRIADGVGQLVSSLKARIKGDVLFSDRAMSEITYMFERTRDVLVNTKDMVLAPNTLVARHIAESQRVVERMAYEYATRHEERLIEGLCAPKASQIYLEMLDSFKSIAWHAKEIAKDLGK